MGTSPFALFLGFSVLLLFTGTPSLADCGGFHKSCRTPEFHGSTLKVECQTPRGWFIPSEIDLAWCIKVQENGELVCNKLSWDYRLVSKAHCKDLDFEGDFHMWEEHHFTATCKAKNGTRVTSTIDLANCLTNDGGNVRCCDGFRTGTTGGIREVS